MPVVRYFVFVGGALLALLLIANACLPALPVGGGLRSASGVDLSLIRIHSDRKWPERVVFDTSHPTIMAASAPPVTVAAVQPAQTSQKTASAAPLKGQLREAYAQLRPNPGDLRNPKRKRKSVARNHVGPQKMLVAQQRPAFLFGNNIW